MQLIKRYYPYIILIAIIASYWPTHELLISQRPTQSVNVSNITVNMILTFIVVVILFKKIAELFKPKLSPFRYKLLRVSLWLTAVFGLIYWLSLWGYETRW